MERRGSRIWGRGSGEFSSTNSSTMNRIKGLDCGNSVEKSNPFLLNIATSGEVLGIARGCG